MWIKAVSQYFILSVYNLHISPGRNIITANSKWNEDTVVILQILRWTFDCKVDRLHVPLHCSQRWIQDGVHFLDLWLSRELSNELRGVNAAKKSVVWEHSILFTAVSHFKAETAVTGEHSRTFTTLPPFLSLAGFNVGTFYPSLVQSWEEIYRIHIPAQALLLYSLLFQAEVIHGTAWSNLCRL